EAPGVRLEVVDRERFPPVFPLSLCDAIICLLWRNDCAPPELRRCPGAGDVFALSLRQQPIALPGLGAEPSHITLSVIPGNVNHWGDAATPTVVGRQIAVATAVGNAGVPFVERD